ncbi:putative FMN/FAD exporter YeeO [Koleobacter methoxysyntrophicus]|uniref:Probable multidrug resistance protein NorM n=2 Tax=Koleobacter methoxysyntrophicus TaxID=2751313 RepID=A0A8A0RRA1_9FIRM|nr:putative FMN/FAD exporter YeeO [Koleobacter methoxysyntrophicus]
MKLKLSLNKMKKEILYLAWPAIAEQALLTITQIVDMAMVGRLGADAVAAVGFSMQPLFFGMAIFASLGVGAVALISRFVGANEHKKASKVLGQAVNMSIFLGLLYALVIFFLSEKIIIFLGGEPSVVSLGSSYLKLISPGLVFMLLSFVMTSAMRGAGDTLIPMKVNVLVNVLNVAGNYILIFGKMGFPALGVDGAAISTSISRFVGMIITLVVLFRGKSRIRINTGDFYPFKLPLVTRILNIGIPSSMEQLAMRIAFIFFVKIVASLGTVAYAAHQIAINAEAISYMPGFGLAMAATTLVGQNLGAKKPKRAEISGYESLKIGIFIMGFMGIVIFLFPNYLMAIYTSDPEIIKLGSVCLRISALGQIPMATFMVVSGGLRGAGDTRFIFYVTLISTWVIRIFFSYFIVIKLGLGLFAAWWAMVLDWSIRGFLVLWRFKQGEWKNIRV